VALKRALVVAASAFVALNLWTGAPLLALWLGSHLVSRIALSMSAVGVVIGVMAATVYLMTMLLLWLNGVYRRISSIPEETRHQHGWSSPLAQQEHPDHSTRPRLTPVEWAIVISVQLAGVSFVIWFLFIAGSPLPH
jgi:nicotinamide riboside transporter PnuC